jgi:peptidoglycan L-alanyl-D-glutamate endopeptidase CwlK
VSVPLDGLHPSLIAAVTRVLTTMESLGHPMTVTAALRSTAQQQALYAQGRTTPGSIVTQCDGVLKRSNHQPDQDGWGRAVDCAFLVNGLPSWAETLPWRLYGEVGKALGCRWGGEFVSFVDRPHLEWPTS